jgi:hypothetical protein
MALFKGSFRFSAVAVIQSLPPNEDQTGTWLAQRVLGPVSLSHGMNILEWTVGNRTELFAALAGLAQFVRQSGRFPIVHFETHGEEAGVRLANKELVSWGELALPLREINGLAQMNLLVILGACHGAHLLSALSPGDIAPVWGLLGPPDPILPARLQDAWQTLYPVLTEPGTLNDALDAIHTARGTRRPDIVLETAERWYCIVFKEYVRQLADPANLKRREDELVAAIARGTNYGLERAMVARYEIRRFLSDNPALYESYRQRFLMLDQFPQNGSRFTISYAGCCEDSGAAE